MTDVPTLVEHFHYLGLFLLLVLGGMGLPIPEAMTLMLCGFLISHEVIRPVYALIVVFAGMLTGDFLIFSVGRKYGRKVVTLMRFRRILTPQRLSKLEHAFNRRRALIILFGRHLGFHVFLVAGILRIPYLKFMALDIVSSILAIAALVGAGYAAGNSLQVLEKDITRVEHIGILLAVGSLLIYLLFRYLKANRKQAAS